MSSPFKNALANLTTQSAVRTERRNESSINTLVHFDDVTTDEVMTDE